MSRPYRFLAVHLLVVLATCVLIGFLGYNWLRLDREARARRGKESAEAEAVRIRARLRERLAQMTGELSRSWEGRWAGRLPYAPPLPAPDSVQAAYLFEASGRLLYPDYDAAYRRALISYQSAVGRPLWQREMDRAEVMEARGSHQGARGALLHLMSLASTPTLRAALLLRLGRVALAARQYGAAEAHAWQILECCPSERDEYGLSFALSAAVQLAAAWEAQGKLGTRFPQLATRLGGLIEAGAIGHPKDLQEIAALVAKPAVKPAASALLRQAEQAAGRIRQHMETARRLQKWMAGSELLRRGGAGLVLSTFWADSHPQVAAVQRTTERHVLAVLFLTERLALETEARNFEIALAPEGANQAAAGVRVPLLPHAPGIDLVLRARESDPATERRRQTLFGGALAAGVLLLLLVGYFAFRDVVRELRLASLRSSFVASVTHELKTPLTSIQLLAETVRRRRTRDPGAEDEMLGAILDESARLSRLLDNVLAFARIEKGAQEYHPAATNLGDAVDGAVERFGYLLERDGFRLSQESNGEPLHVYADPAGLAQALLNLLSNAVKYSGRSRKICLVVQRRGDEAEIRITDYGIGIPQSEQERIFESFYRAPEAAREAAGAGLGLALVRHFAEAHAGRVTLSSEPGKGSSFSLWLPLVQDHG